MYNENKNRFLLPAMIIRGGTSKGVYLLEEDLPEDKSQWDSLLLSMMGSPDKKQIDGLGGAQSVTSKVAIVKKSSREDADVDYTFAQVSVDKDLVSYKGNCGNISSGVGPFAIEKGLIKTKEGTTPVRIFNTNTNKVIIADVQTEKGSVVYDGDFAIAGVPGTAAPIKLKFVEPAGTLGNGLLPTGNVVDILEVPNFGKVEVSIVDAANPLVFVKAKDMGMTGLELPEEVSDKLWKRTDYTWPCTWFAPRCDGKEGAFKTAYDVMNNWGANHGAISYGHIGADLITMCSMLRIPVSMHNVPEKDIYRPAAWNAFGMDKEGADFRACKNYGPLYK